MSPPARLLVVLVVCLLVAATSAGCLRRDGGRGADDPGASRLVISLVGLDTPEGEDTLVVNLTVDHLAFHDSATGDWVPLLTRARTTDVLFAEGGGDPSFLVALPLLDGAYDAVEILVTKARVITADGASDAETPAVACYAPLTLGAAGEADLVGLELWLGGPDALARQDATWRFQPALVGTVSDADAGDAELGEADCRPY